MIRRALISVGSLLWAAMVLTGCAEVPGGPTTPSPVEPVQIVQFAGQLTASGTLTGTEIRDVAVERDGELVATLTWTSSTGMGLVLTDTSCGTRDFYGCTILTRASMAGGLDGERLTQNVRRGQMLRFWVQNLDRGAGAQYVLDVAIR